MQDESHKFLDECIEAGQDYIIDDFFLPLAINLRRNFATCHFTFCTWSAERRGSRNLIKISVFHHECSLLPGCPRRAEQCFRFSHFSIPVTAMNQHLASINKTPGASLISYHYFFLNLEWCAYLDWFNSKNSDRRAYSFPVADGPASVDASVFACVIIVVGVRCKYSDNTKFTLGSSTS